jgi:hypothetical protein
MQHSTSAADRVGVHYWSATGHDTWGAALLPPGALVMRGVKRLTFINLERGLHFVYSFS